MLNEMIYRRVYKNSNQSPDGETPSQIIVTKESNGYAVWDMTFEKGQELIQYVHCLYDRESALEIGVTLYLRRNKEQKQ